MRIPLQMIAGLVCFPALLCSTASAQSLVNGTSVTGAVSPVGDTDTYTFNANAGESLSLRVVDLSGGLFAPGLTVTDPGGAFVTSDAGTVVGAVSFTAGSSGTFSVVVADFSSGQAQTGGYELHYVGAPGANEHGSLINGGSVTETITTGDLDSYTFTAAAGENVQLRASDLSNTGFAPLLVAYSPTGSFVTFDSGALVAALNFSAPTTGTYTLLVADGTSAQDQAGGYELHYVGAPGANEHGSLINGGSVTETITTGDLDSYTFTAAAGENVLLRASDLSNTGFAPLLVAYSPTGSFVTFDSGALVAALNFSAPTTGTYTLLVADGTSAQDQAGGYELHYVGAPGANEHGPLISGTSVTETILTGDLDSYTFSAAAGENVVLRASDLSDTAFAPLLVAYSPTGAFVTSDAGAIVAALSFVAATTGTYTVVVADGTSAQDQSGGYELNFARRIPGADGDGPLVNGGTVTGTIEVGDLDTYSFTAAAGENVLVRVHDLSNTAFAPLLVAYNPTGGFVTSDAGAVVGAISFVAPTTGTYTLLVADGTSAQNQGGDYEVHYVRAPGASEHGPLIDGGSLTETITTGDLDSYTFTAAAGENVVVRAGDLSNTAFTPLVVAYSPSGSFVTSGAGASTGAISFVAPTSGTYTLLVADGTSAQDQGGAYEVHYARMPGANENGSFVSGQTLAGEITLADIDTFTFALNAGGQVQIDVTDTSGTAFTPLLVIYNPLGAFVTSDADANVATVNVTGALTGTYTALIVDGTSAAGQTGTYGVEFLGGMGSTNTFCQSSPNSVDPTGALIAATGSTSFSVNDFGLTASPIQAGAFGIFYYGVTEISFPFGQGIRCVGGQTFRLPFVSANAAGELNYAVDNTALPAGGDFFPGRTWKFQAWYRDIAGGGSGFNLSNGLSATFAP